MDYAAAIAISMILVFLMGIGAIIVGLIIAYNTSSNRVERNGFRVAWIGGGGFILLAFLGWFAAIWIGFAQTAATGAV